MCEHFLNTVSEFVRLCVFVHLHNHMPTTCELFRTDDWGIVWLYKFEYVCVWNSSACFLSNGNKCKSIYLLLVIPFFPVNVCESLYFLWVRQSLLVSQENTESCKSEISFPGGGPRRLAGRFHLSHIAPWSTWLLLASPISLPFVPICAQRSACLYIQRVGWERATNPQTWKLAAHIPTMNTFKKKTRPDVLPLGNTINP